MSDHDRTVHTFDGLASRIDALGVRTVCFTSALSAEGVSTIALGVSLALADLRQGTTLLVDANWLQPSLTADAHVESAPGLADCLVERTALAKAIRPCAVSRLAFLPIGDRAVARPTLRALASFLTAGVNAFDSVVIDLPPVLTGEAYVLPWASLVDQLFVVLREGATPLPLARQALERIGLTTPPYIVLNRAMAAAVELPSALRVART